MSDEIQPPTDQEIFKKAEGFAKELYSLRGYGKGTERELARRMWVRYLQGLKKNSRRTIARQAYWEEYDRLERDGESTS